MMQGVLSACPLQPFAGINFYAYVDNNPVNANDPTGMDAFTTAAKYGGRLGSAETRAHIVATAKEYISKGWQLISGGGTPETLIKNPVTNSSKGGAYADIELFHPETAQRLRINTIDTYANGLPTAREAANGARIQALRPNDQFMMIPKPSASQVAVGTGAGLAAGGAQASTANSSGSGFSWLDFAIDFITPGGINSLGNGTLWSTPPNSGGASGSWGSTSGATGSWGSSSAAGGYLLYPNKANNNMMQSVYSK